MNEIVLIAPDKVCNPYVVAWFAHANNWVEIARVPNPDDAKQITAMFNNGLSLETIKNGEIYAYFRLSDFDRVVQR